MNTKTGGASGKQALGGRIALRAKAKSRVPKNSRQCEKVAEIMRML